MPRNLYSRTSPLHPPADPLRGFIQRAQMALVCSRRSEGRLPLHDSFRLTLGARSGDGVPVASHSGAWRGSRLQPTVYAGGRQPAERLTEA